METLKTIIEEHKSFGTRIFKLAKSDLVRTYRGAALGWAWAFVKPTITLFVFWFAFTVGLRTGSTRNGYPYFLWLLSGFLPWFYMRDMLAGGTDCIRKYSDLVTKMRFPVSIIPTYTSMAHMIVHIVLLTLGIITFWLFGFPPDKYYLQLPVYMLMMWAFSVPWALFTGMLGALSKDFANLVKSCSQALFWMSGIIYDVNNIRHEWIRTLLKFNPVTVISTGYRKCLIYKEWFWVDKIDLLGYATTFIIMMLLALWAYKKLRKEIPDVL